MATNLNTGLNSGLNPGLRQSISGGVDSLGLFRSASLDLRFADKRTLTDRVSGNNLVTFSRASSGTFVGSNGLIQTAAANEPRFDHDPVTGESLGLLIEGERINLFLNSDTLSTQSVTSTAVDYALSFSGTGTVTLSGNATGSLAGTGANERVSLIVTATAGTITATVAGTVENGQFEAGSFPTSYIPTASSTVTRAADVASITGTNFSSFYNEPASTLYIESPNFPNYENISNGSFVYISDVNTNSTPTGDGIKFGTSSPATGTRIFVTEAGATQAQFPVGAGSKFAIAVSENDVSYIIDGASEGTDNTVVVPTGMNRLVITPYGPGLAHISRLAYFPTRKTDQELVNMTS